MRKECGIERLQYRITKTIFKNAEMSRKKRIVGRPMERWQSDIEKHSEAWSRFKEDESYR